MKPLGIGVLLGISKVGLLLEYGYTVLTYVAAIGVLVIAAYLAVIIGGAFLLFGALWVLATIAELFKISKDSNPMKWVVLFIWPPLAYACYYALQLTPWISQDWMELWIRFVISQIALIFGIKYLYEKARNKLGAYYERKAVEEGKVTVASDKHFISKEYKKQVQSEAKKLLNRHLVLLPYWNKERQISNAIYVTIWAGLIFVFGSAILVLPVGEHFFGHAIIAVIGAVFVLSVLIKFVGRKRQYALGENGFDDSLDYGIKHEEHSLRINWLLDTVEAHANGSCGDPFDDEIYF